MRVANLFNFRIPLKVLKSTPLASQLQRLEIVGPLRVGIRRAATASEACHHIPGKLLNLAPDVPWKKIRGIGNILRHEYYNTADDVILSNAHSLPAVIGRGTHPAQAVGASLDSNCAMTSVIV